MTREVRIREYASEVVADCALDRITSVARFDAGDRHAVYQVSYVHPAGDARHVVVRISTRRGIDACAEATREAAVVAAASGVAAPVLHDVRCESQWFDEPVICMEYVAGQHREPAAAAPDDLRRLGSLIAVVHQLPTDGLLELHPTSTGVASYLDERHAAITGKLPPLRDVLPGPLRDRVENASSSVRALLASARTRASLQSDEPLVLLHGDPGPNNIIWTPAPVLIDWEYARLGDPADEIAYLFGQHGLTAARREAFWRGYEERSDPRRLEHLVDRVDSWEPLTLLGSSLWWLERWSRRVDADDTGTHDPATARPQTYYLEHAHRRLDALDKILG